MSVKFVGVILLSLAVTLPGFIINEKLILRKKYLRFFCDLTARLPLSMLDGGESIFEILSRESGEGFKYLATIDKGVINDHTALKRLFINNRIELGDAEEIADFFVSLGNGSFEQQKKHCEIFSNRFGSLLKAAEESAKDRGRLYKVMFVSLGLTVFIILI